MEDEAGQKVAFELSVIRERYLHSGTGSQYIAAVGFVLGGIIMLLTGISLFEKGLWPAIFVGPAFSWLGVVLGMHMYRKFRPIEIDSEGVSKILFFGRYKLYVGPRSGGSTE